MRFVRRGQRRPASDIVTTQALDEPGRPGVRKIAARFGVDPGTVQRISRPFRARKRGHVKRGRRKGKP